MLRIIVKIFVFIGLGNSPGYWHYHRATQRYWRFLWI